MTIFVNVLGWIGVLFLLGTYFLSAIHKMNPHSWTYRLLNLIGGIFLVLVNIEQRAYQSGCMNTIWSIIALISIIHALFHKPKSASEQSSNTEESDIISAGH